MPKRTDLKSILIIGAGPIVIGQACEFDYSGAQACRRCARRLPGLLGIPTRHDMTDPEGRCVYIVPVTWRTVARIRERAVRRACPRWGGRRAQHRTELAEGVLRQYNVE